MALGEDKLKPLVRAHAYSAFQPVHVAWLLDRRQAGSNLHAAFEELGPPCPHSGVGKDIVRADGVTPGRGQETIVDALAAKLDARLREWKPETAAEARQRIAEIIELADHDILDIARGRTGGSGPAR